MHSQIFGIENTAGQDTFFFALYHSATAMCNNIILLYIDFSYHWDVHLVIAIITSLCPYIVLQIKANFWVESLDFLYQALNKPPLISCYSFR